MHMWTFLLKCWTFLQNKKVKSIRYKSKETKSESDCKLKRRNILQRFPFACFVHWVIPDNGMCIGMQPKTHSKVFNSKLHIQRGQNQDHAVEASESEKNPWLKNALETVVSEMSFLLLFSFLFDMHLHNFCYFHFSIFK